MRARSTAFAAALGCAAALGLVAPANAATTPTITVPASRQGYGPITITGTATPGATVELYESAYVFNDFYASPDYSTGGVITAKASSSGAYSISRILDSGFRFYVKVDGVESRRVSVAMGIQPSLTIVRSGNTVTAGVASDPAQPYLSVHVQRSSNNSTWTDIAGGYTSDPAATFSATVGGQPNGNQYYRAVIDADTDNNLLRGQSATVAVNFGGTVTPAPASPAVGSLQFTRINYAPKPATLNNEWAQVTNKTKATVNLKGWTVRDAGGSIYTFTTNLNLAAGKHIYLRTGKGTSGSLNRYWGKTGAVWNDGGDTATLRAPGGKTIDTCKWTKKGAGTTNC
jgi:hypothetical protein